LTWEKDKDITELVNSALETKKSIATITRWRNKKKYPKDLERRLIEDKIGLPFDVLYKDVNFDTLIDRLEKQLKGVRKMKIKQSIQEAIKKESLK
jgi:hypothetical protein